MGILDRFQFKKTPKEAIKDGSIFKASIRDQDVFRFLDNEINFHDGLRRIGGRHKLEKLKCDDEIQAALDTRLNACEKLKMDIVGGDDSVNEFMREQIMPHARLAARYFWDSIPFGFSSVQVVYSRLGGRSIGIEKLFDQPIEWFDIKRDGTKTIKTNFLEEEECLEYKYIFSIRKPSYKHPMGEPLLANLYWPYYFRCNGWKFWAQYVEKFAQPFLVGKTDDANLDEMQKLLSQARRASTITLDKESDVEILQSSSKASEFKDFDQALVQRIQKVILGQTLTSNVGSTGSFAAAKVHDGVRSDRRDADCVLVENSFNELIKNLMDLNGFSGDVPTFQLGGEKGIESERAARDAVLANAGIVKFTQKYLTENYDFEDDDIEEIDQDDGEGDFSFANVHDSDHGHDHSDNNLKFAKKEPLPDKLQSLVEDAISASTEPVNIEEIRDVVADSRNANELAQRLFAIHQGDDTEYMDNLTRSLFAAHILGFQE